MERHIELLDAFSTVGYVVALIYVLRIRNKLIDLPTKYFILSFIGVYLFVGISNVLEHGGITAYLDRLEDYMEILFIPLFLAFIYSVYKTKSEEELKKAKMEIEQDKIRIETIISSLGEGISIQDKNFRVIYQNKALKDMVGEHEGEWCYTAYEKRASICEGCPVAKSLSDGGIHSASRTAPTDAGTLYVEITASPLKDIAGNIIAGIEVVRNVTEKKRIEREIRDSRQWLNLQIKQTPLGVIEWTLDRRVKAWNPAAEQIFGYADREAIGKHASELVPPNDPAGERMITGLFGMQGGSRSTTENITRDGSRIICEWFNTPLVDEQGQVIGAASLVHDVTERKRAIEILADERERLAVTLRSIGDGVIVTDTSGTITLLNKVAEHLTGWTHDEATGKPLTDVFNIINESTREKCANPAEKVRRTGMIAALTNHTALVRKDGSEIIIADSAAPIQDKQSRTIGVVLVFRDITAQYRMEQEMQKIQKLESLGLLAGGLAHDFNNLLTSILGNVSLVKMQIGSGHKSIGRLMDAEKAARRATDLTQQLLTFAKGGAPVKNPASIAEIAKEACQFAMSGSNVQCVYTIPGDLWHGDIDKGQINQVFNNLMINAIHAMPNGGTVHLVFENVTIQERDATALKPGDYVKITFKDNGIGIPEDSLGRIFEPYFTTKTGGSGLGLATVLSIIKRHEGDISVVSQLGVGTTFTLYVPAILDTIAPAPEGRDRVPAGHGKILVMDDDELVRGVAGEILKELGYEVAFAKDGKEAIEAYMNAEREQKPFDVVIMDLTIPGGMGGQEAVKNLHAVAPAAKVVVSSGYSMDPIMAEYRKYGFVGVVCKPYNANEIGELIARVKSNKN